MHNESSFQTIFFTRNALIATFLATDVIPVYPIIICGFLVIAHSDKFTNIENETKIVCLCGHLQIENCNQ